MSCSRPNLSRWILKVLADEHHPLGAVPKKLMELAIIAADVVQAHPWGAVRHTQRFVKDGGTVPEFVEAVALAMIEEGVHSYKTCGWEVIEAAEHLAAAPARPS